MSRSQTPPGMIMRGIAAGVVGTGVMTLAPTIPAAADALPRVCTGCGCVRGSGRCGGPSGSAMEASVSVPEPGSGRYGAAQARVQLAAGAAASFDQRAARRVTRDRSLSRNVINARRLAAATRARWPLLVWRR